MRTGTESYYARRALEYDEVYDKPERQHDLAGLRDQIPVLLGGRQVLEVAAGTGYWTSVYADAAEGVVATDINPAVLDVARGRREWPRTVKFIVDDGLVLRNVPGTFNAAFVGFFWSHVPAQALDGFLATLTDR